MTQPASVVEQHECLITTEEDASRFFNTTVVRLDFSNLTSATKLSALSTIGGLRRPESDVWHVVQARLIDVLPSIVGDSICANVRVGSHNSIDLELDADYIRVGFAKGDLAAFLSQNGVDCGVVC